VHNCQCSLLWRLGNKATNLWKENPSSPPGSKTLPDYNFSKTYYQCTAAYHFLGFSWIFKNQSPLNKMESWRRCIMGILDLFLITGTNWHTLEPVLVPWAHQVRKPQELNTWLCHFRSLGPEWLIGYRVHLTAFKKLQFLRAAKTTILLAIKGR